MGDVPDVAVARINLGGCGGDWHIVRSRIGEAILARAKIPDAPGRNDRKVGSKRHIRQLEPYLVVALAGAAVGQRISADGARDLDLLFRDERTRHRGAEQVLPVVDRPSPKRRPDKIAHIFGT